MSRKTPSTKKLVIYVHVEGGKNICNIKFIIFTIFKGKIFSGIKYIHNVWGVGFLGFFFSETGSCSVCLPGWGAVV